MKRSSLILVVVLISFASIGAHAADGLGATGSVTLASCVETSSNVICEMHDISRDAIGFSGLHVGDVAVFTCEPNADAFAVSVVCDARISDGSTEGDPLPIAQGDRVMLSSCIAQSVFAYPDYDDPRMLPFIRLDCALGGPAPQRTGLEQPWAPDVVPSNPDDVTWPPLVSGYDFPTSDCLDSGNGSYTCAPTPDSYGFIMPEDSRIETGERVAFNLTAGGVISVSFLPKTPGPMPSGEGGYAGDQITFTDCTGPLLSDWVYMRTVYCTVGPIEPGPRPR